MPPYQTGVTGGAVERQRRTLPSVVVGATDVAKVRAVEFVRRMRGASQPCLLRCEDGSSYIVKFRNNPQHARVLANEMMACRLALLVGLPVPAPAFVDVPDELIRNNPLLSFEIGGERKPYDPGVQFGSRFPGFHDRILVVDFLPDRLLRRVRNLTSVLLGAFVFDKWTCNCDGRQVIFYRGEDEESSSYSLAIIDQGFCFNDGEWNFPDNPFRSFYPRRFVYESVRGFKSFEPYLSKIENSQPNKLEDCVCGIPREWCEPDPEQLMRLVQTLYDRRRKLRQAIIDAKNCSLDPFPNWA